MARPLRIQFPGAYYHITCRGIERRNIYYDDKDREMFLSFLKESLEIYQVVLYAFILMPNHFHLLIQTKKANCSEFMRQFNVRYTVWFNHYHKRVGNLYQGRYKAHLVDADSYFLELSRYIHLNIVRVSSHHSLNYKQLLSYLHKYQWSSLAGYFDKKFAKYYIDYKKILLMAGGRRQYRRFIVDGLKRDISDPFKKVKFGLFIGDDDFIEEIKTKYIKDGSERDQPSYRHLLSSKIEPEVVINKVSELFNVGPDKIIQRSMSGIVRGILSEMLYCYSDLTQREIGKLLDGIDYSAVNKLRTRLKKRMDDNENIQKIFKKVKKSIEDLSNVEI